MKILARAENVAELAERAFQGYLNARWDEAEQLYGELPNEKLAGTFIARCREFRTHPPGDGWDGVFTMTTK